MSRVLALLGSITVGGNRIKMADLKATLEVVGFRDRSVLILPIERLG